MMMKTQLKILATIAVATTPLAAQAELKPGTRAPAFSTQAALAGKPFAFSLASALKKGPVVLYFFPKTFTSGCTIEAHEFAEKTADFAKLGATVIGMSADSIADLSRFSKEDCRDKFAVGVATPAMIKGYDVALAMAPGRSNRTSYVIVPGGRIIYSHNAMEPLGHISGTFAAVQAWKAAKR